MIKSFVTKGLRDNSAHTTLPVPKWRRRLELGIEEIIDQ